MQAKPHKEPSPTLKIIQDLAPLSRVFCSPDYDFSLDYLQKLLPNPKLFSYKKEDEHNGWQIPPRWVLAESWIKDKDGNLCYNGLHHPLATISYSASFAGFIKGSELKKHLFSCRHDPERISFHFRNSYRPWDREWGFSVPTAILDAIQNEELYEVCIRTEEAMGELKILEAQTGKGQSGLKFVFVAHLDHPGMANDDLAGVAAGVELLRRLSKKDLRHSYHLLVVQELIGSQFYLQDFRKRNPEQRPFFEGLFLEMPGTDTPLALQASMNGQSLLEDALKSALDTSKLPFRQGKFKCIIGNDESIFEAYGVPMASLSRYPFEEYHTDADNASLMDEKALEEYVSILEQSVDLLEKTSFYQKIFDGVICLSNPSYNLYIDSGQPAFEAMPPAEILNLRQIMDYLPLAQEIFGAHQLSQLFSVPLEQVQDYLSKWVKAGLLKEL